MVPNLALSTSHLDNSFDDDPEIVEMLEETEDRKILSGFSFKKFASSG